MLTYPMPPVTQNPLLIVAYVVGLLLSLPVLYAVWKVAVFFAKAIAKLDQIDTILQTLEVLLREKASESFGVEMSLTVIESDINALQEHNNLPVRQYPDRRTGPSDRRRAG